MGFQPSRSSSLALLAVGFAITLAGLVFYAVESEYGWGLNLAMEVQSNGPTRDINPEAATRVWDADTGQVLFEGTHEDADAFVRSERARRTNVLLPAIVIVVGGATVMAGIVTAGMAWKRRSRK